MKQTWLLLDALALLPIKYLKPSYGLLFAVLLTSLALELLEGIVWSIIYQFLSSTRFASASSFESTTLQIQSVVFSYTGFLAYPVLFVLVFFVLSKKTVVDL